MALTRIYLVQPIKSKQFPDGFRLVRATNVNQALRHVAADLINGELACQDDLVRLLSAGVKVEDAGEVKAEADAHA